MEGTELTVERAGERLVPTPQRTLWWPDRRVLFAADVHVGRATSMRQRSVPLPPGPLPEALGRLQTSIDRLGPDRLVVLGDLVEERGSTTQRVVEAAAPVFEAVEETLVVRGNHDRSHGPLPPSWNVEVVDGPHRLGPFALRHQPEPIEDAYVLAGHLHPTVELRTGADEVRLPCFALDTDVAVLPAVHSMTNGVRVDLRSGQSIFALADGELVEVTPS